MPIRILRHRRRWVNGACGIPRAEPWQRGLQLLNNPLHSRSRPRLLLAQLCPSLFSRSATSLHATLSTDQSLYHTHLSPLSSFHQVPNCPASKLQDFRFELNYQRYMRLLWFLASRIGAILTYFTRFPRVFKPPLSPIHTLASSSTSSRPRMSMLIRQYPSDQ